MNAFTFGDENIPTDVAIGDFNGDGLGDIVVGSVLPGDIQRGAITVLIARPDGTFADPVYSSTNQANSPAVVQVADFNGDAIADVVALYWAIPVAASLAF